MKKQKTSNDQLMLDFSNHIAEMNKHAKAAGEVLKKIEASKQKVTDSQREDIRKLVAWYSYREKIEFKEAWAMCYDEMAEATKKHPALIERLPGEKSKLDVVERCGLLKDLHAAVGRVFMRRFCPA